MARDLHRSRVVRSFQQTHPASPVPTGPRYRLLRLVGQGGMGRVYEAIRAVDGRRVALKILRPRLANDARSRRHMRREAHALAAASHPNVVRFLELGATRTGRPYLALEWLDGITLHELIGRAGPLSPQRALALFAQILDALELIHARGIVHGDLKPENIMILDVGLASERVCLIDFGIASLAREAWGDDVNGTPGYLAPEVISGHPASPACDLYAAGVILFELLTGTPAFVAESLAETFRLQAFAPPPRPSAVVPCLPEDVDAVIARALAVTPSLRYLDAAALRQAATAALAAAAVHVSSARIADPTCDRAATTLLMAVTRVRPTAAWRPSAHSRTLCGRSPAHTV